MALDDILVFNDADFEMDVDQVPFTEYAESPRAVAQQDISEACVDHIAQDEQTCEVLDDEMGEDDPACDSRFSMIQQLESLMLDFLGQVLHAMPSTGSSNTIQERRKKIVIELVDRRKPVRDDESLPMRQLVFPQRSKHTSSKCIAQFLRVVDLIHEALVTRTPTTKRDMYYKDVPLFGTQAVVDRLVDDIAATIGARRADLNVRASSKGLISGKGLKMHKYAGEIITTSIRESTLIPPSEDIQRYEVEEGISWVLVVEKEAVFQTLIHLQLAEHPDLPGHGLIITGKGYPDLATRQLVCALSENLPMTVPILALVDCDPYGIDILSVYKYGSVSMSHEQESLIAPRIAWAGVRSEDIAELDIDRDALIPITKYDQKKALAMLRCSDLPRKWRRELQHMLHNRRKAEIEIMSLNDAVLSRSYLTDEGLAYDDTTAGRSYGLARRGGLLEYVVKRINRAVQKSAEKFGP